MFTLFCVSVPWISISILEISWVVVHLLKFCTIIQGMRKTSFESLVNDGTICMEDTEQQFDGSMPYFSVVTISTKLRLLCYIDLKSELFTVILLWSKQEVICMPKIGPNIVTCVTTIMDSLRDFLLSILDGQINQR